MLGIIYCAPSSATNAKRRREAERPQGPAAAAAPERRRRAGVQVDPAGTSSYYGDGGYTMSEDRPKELDNKVVIMNGFTNEEIGKIIKAVRGVFDTSADLIFAKTTPNSVEMVLKDLIVDMSEDHEYLKKNPPEEVKRRREEKARREEAQSGGQESESGTSAGAGDSAGAGGEQES